MYTTSHTQMRGAAAAIAACKTEKGKINFDVF